MAPPRDEKLLPLPNSVLSHDEILFFFFFLQQLRLPLHLTAPLRGLSNRGRAWL